VTRGRKPTAAIADAQKFAEWMGYHWMENPGPDMPFDFLIFKKDSVRVVRVRQTRNQIDPEAFYEKKYPDEVADLRSLPFPPFVFRELWLKTRGEKVYRRLHVTDFSVGEIEWWGPDKYTNPHARREIPRKPGPTGKFIVRKSAGPRVIIPPVNPPERVLEK
jgi:hypothetical protein